MVDEVHGLPGLRQHFSGSDELTEAIFSDGLGFDGSSIRGWKSIHTSDMLVVPDPDTAVMDPFTQYPTLSLICNVIDPITKESYDRDPRYIAIKAENYMKSTKIADTAYFGPEAEFFILDDVMFDQTSNSGYYFIDSSEGIWNSGREEGPNLGFKPRHKEGYFPVPPTDSRGHPHRDGREMQRSASIERQHRGRDPGKAEIDMRFNSMTSGRP
jgi:glutamine synthetase